MYRNKHEASQMVPTYPHRSLNNPILIPNLIQSTHITHLRSEDEAENASEDEAQCLELR